jgi:hypothetical protein
MYLCSATEWISSQVFNRVSMNDTYKVRQWDFYIAILLRTQENL